MFEKIEKKLVNILIFFDLTKMKKKMPEDFSSVKKVQDKRVRRLVRKAYKIPFYRKRFVESGITPRDIRTGEGLAKLPLLTKEELRAWMNEEEKNAKYDNWFRDTTSGSSGEPLMVLLSPREKAYMMANWFRVMMLAGYNPFLGKTMSRRSAHSITGGYDTVMQKFGILRREFVAQYDPEDSVVRTINEYRPDFLYMNKTEFMRICLYCKNNNVELWKPRYYVPTGEKIDDAAKELFYEILGDGMIDSYGTAEAGACMVKLPGSDEHVVHNDSFVVNVYNDNDELDDEGKIAVTPLYKTDLPLINYVVGDRCISEKRDGVRFVKSIQGRLNDFFKYRTGEVTTFFEIAPVIAHCDSILQIRFIQDSYEELRIQCVFNEERKNQSRDSVEKQLTEDLQRKFKHPFNISYEWMESIPPDKNGKLRMIVCNI